MNKNALFFLVMLFILGCNSPYKATTPGSSSIELSLENGIFIRSLAISQDDTLVKTAWLEYSSRFEGNKMYSLDTTKYIVNLESKYLQLTRESSCAFAPIIGITNNRVFLMVTDTSVLNNEAKVTLNRLDGSEYQIVFKNIQ
jgi:hypothetical protein